jgi:hypothetical protein
MLKVASGNTRPFPFRPRGLRALERVEELPAAFLSDLPYPVPLAELGVLSRRVSLVSGVVALDALPAIIYRLR